MMRISCFIGAKGTYRLSAGTAGRSGRIIAGSWRGGRKEGEGENGEDREAREHLVERGLRVAKDTGGRIAEESK